MDKAVEAMARAIAQGQGDDYDLAFPSKSAWIAARGMSGGRARDVNEPFQGDYDEAAQAALAAYHAHLAEQGLVIVPEVPTDGMVKAGFEDYPTIWTAAVTPEDRIGVYTAMIQAAKER